MCGAAMEQLRRSLSSGTFRLQQSGLWQGGKTDKTQRARVVGLMQAGLRNVSSYYKAFATQDWAPGASSPLLEAHQANRFNRIALQQAFSMSARHGKKEGLCLLVQRQVERNIETSVVVFDMIARGPGASR